jgi:hypothetical protein
MVVDRESLSYWRPDHLRRSSAMNRSLCVAFVLTAFVACDKKDDAADSPSVAAPGVTVTPTGVVAPGVTVTPTGVVAPGVKVSQTGVVVDKPPPPPAAPGAAVPTGAVVGPASMQCTDGNCSQVCQPNQACNFGCSGGRCTQTCAAGSTCSFSCSGGNCKQSCGGAATCNKSCTGGGCS